MTEAELAFAFAEEAIIEAAEMESPILSFENEKYRALDRLPESISELVLLRQLFLSRTHVTELAPISELQQLEELWLQGTPLRDISPLAGMFSLKDLVLNETDVEDISPLARLTELRDLHLNNTPVSDISVVANLSLLDELQFGRTRVSDIKPLENLEKLQYLDLIYTPVMDLRPLRKSLERAAVGRLNTLMLDNCAAVQADPRIAEILRQKDQRARARILLKYLEDWEPTVEAPPTSVTLQGPILSDSLIDIEREADQFYAAALTDIPAKPMDRRHDELVQTLAFISGRIGNTATENRLGKEICQNFRDYAQFVRQSPVNGRILWFLANGVRAVLADPYEAEALDGFDTSQVTGFLSENDALIQEYYPDAMRGAQFETETPPDVLSRELRTQLVAARDILAAEDARGVFAPNVSDTLEMLIRREEGARRGYLTAATEEDREAAGKELQRISVQSTAVLGRIKGRLKQWLKNTGEWAKIQAAHAKDNPITTLGGIGTASVPVYWVVQQLTPVFEFLWKLIGNLALPF
ncbi:MAG: leucine-rich repeat domain-containing protein [Pseudomonadota bacterium]